MSGREGLPGDRGPAPPDAGHLEPVAGAARDLRRELGRMRDGRDITYYWSSLEGVSQEPDRPDGDRPA